MAVILVTDGGERSALATVRSLGRAGHRVEVTSASGRSLAGASRHAAADHEVPRPLSDPEIYADSVLSLANSLGARIVLPVTEASLLALLPRRDQLEDGTIPVGELTALRGLLDKEQVLEVAREVGLAAPRQQIVSEPSSDPVIDLEWPVVVKPARSVAGGAEHRVGHASDLEDLERLRARYDPGAYPLLLQERVTGPGTGIFLLRWNDETLASFAHRRLREKPPSGGVSVYRESVPMDPDLLAASERLLQRFDWSGVAMVEYKLSRETGRPYLMEVNPRFWGSLQLAVDSGVDFPRLLVNASLGAPPASRRAYETGVRLRWWWGDVDHLIARLKGAVPGDVADGRPHRVAAIREFVTLRPTRDRLEVARMRDPGPFLRESRTWVCAALAARGGA